MPFIRQRSARELLSAVSMNFRTNEDTPEDIGARLVLARMRTDSSTITEVIRTCDLTASDIIVLLMGPPGSGKTTFIEIAGGTKGLVKLNSSEPRTTDISVFRVSIPMLPHLNIVLVDTPAFNDTDKPDIKILAMLSGWLNETYRKGIRLSGLIYFHRITEPKMEGISLRNWRAFEKICGKAFNKVVLTTTMWDSVADEVGHNAERELEVFWRADLARGSSMRCFLRNRLSAANILSSILEDVTKSPLRIQREIIDFNLTLEQTTVARVLYLELEALHRECKRNINTIRDDLKNPSLNKNMLRNLEREYLNSSSLLKRVTGGLSDLKTAPTERLRRFSLMTKFMMMTTFSTHGRLRSSGRKWLESLGQMDARADDSEERRMDGCD